MLHKEIRYTTRLQAGLGLIDETKLLLSIYTPSMTAVALYEKALESGLFPLVSARRLRNIVSECFAPRFIQTDSAKYLNQISKASHSVTLNQFLLIFTALSNQILFDFITDVYWTRYSSGRDSISKDDAKIFIINAVNEGKTEKKWSETTIKRVSSYLIGCCADYGMLSSKRTSERQIQSVRIQEVTLLFFSYWLHFNGVSDNSIVSNDIWKLFGLESIDVREELKRISKKGWIIIQSAGDVTRISWLYNSIEEVVDVIVER